MSVRLIAGKYGGRIIKTPGGKKTHPMGERIRGSLFNILHDIEGYEVCDAFAGSGSVGLEAISRGAQSVVFLESDRRAQRAIDKNIALLGAEEQCRLIKTSVFNWHSNNPEELFDLIICDPPYWDLQMATVSKLVDHLKSNGLMVLSHPGRELAPTVNGVVVVDKRSYGDAALAFYRLKPKKYKRGDA